MPSVPLRWVRSEEPVTRWGTLFVQPHSRDRGETPTFRRATPWGLAVAECPHYGWLRGTSDFRNSLSVLPWWAVQDSNLQPHLGLRMIPKGTTSSAPRDGQGLVKTGECQTIPPVIARSVCTHSAHTGLFRGVSSALGGTSRHDPKPDPSCSLGQAVIEGYEGPPFWPFSAPCQCSRELEHVPRAQWESRRQCFSDVTQTFCG